LRNSVDKNFFISGKNSHYYVVIPVNSWVGTNDQVVDFYSQSDEKVIDLAGMVDINSAELEELTTLPGIGVKTAEKIINKRNELGRYNALEEIMLVAGIGRKTYEKILLYIRIN